jgi:ADP-ribose pyrophosphatase
MTNPTVTTLFQGRHLQLVQQDQWEFARRVKARGAVVIIAITPEYKLLLTEQFRIPLNQRVIELPAGLIGDTTNSETIIQAAERELLEETGYQARHFTPLHTGPSSAGLTDEMITFVQASDLCKTATGGGVEDEAITIHEVPMTELHSWLQIQVRNGLIVDPKIFAGLWLSDAQPHASH